MTARDVKAAELAEVLARCESLTVPSAARDELWLTVRELVCTRNRRDVVPMGSSCAVLVTAEHASHELIAAMEWLHTHEDRARGMAPQDLASMVCGVATRGALGSARAAQADALHGLTHVRPGEPVVFADFDWTDAA